MSNIDKLGDELKLIKSDVIRRLVISALERGASYFWTVPASLTGKYHNPEDRQEGGLMLHSQKVAWIAFKLAEAFELDTDVAVAAGLLHDVMKYGNGIEPDINEYDNHGVKAANWLMVGYDERHYDNEANMTWRSVVGCVASHMGRWGDEKPNSVYEQLFHAADVCASHELLVSTKFYDPDAVIDLPSLAGAKFIQRDGEWEFNFGKYRGKKALEIYMANPGYFRWILSQQAGFDEMTTALTKEVFTWCSEKRAEEIRVARGNLF